MHVMPSVACVAAIAALSLALAQQTGCPATDVQDDTTSLLAVSLRLSHRKKPFNEKTMQPGEVGKQIFVFGAGTNKSNGMYHRTFQHRMKDGGIQVAEHENSEFVITFYPAKTLYGPVWYIQKKFGDKGAYQAKLKEDPADMSTLVPPATGWQLYTGKDSQYSLPGVGPAPMLFVEGAPVPGAQENKVNANEDAPAIMGQDGKKHVVSASTPQGGGSKLESTGGGHKNKDASLSGQWQSTTIPGWGGTIQGTANGARLSWCYGEETDLQVTDPKKFAMYWKGGSYTADIQADGLLHFSDGDVWYKDKPGEKHDFWVPAKAIPKTPDGTPVWTPPGLWIDTPTGLFFKGFTDYTNAKKAFKDKVVEALRTGTADDKRKAMMDYRAGGMMVAQLMPGNPLGGKMKQFADKWSKGYKQVQRAKSEMHSFNSALQGMQHDMPMVLPKVQAFAESKKTKAMEMHKAAMKNFGDMQAQLHNAHLNAIHPGTQQLDSTDDFHRRLNDPAYNSQIIAQEVAQSGGFNMNGQDGVNKKWGHGIKMNANLMPNVNFNMR